MEWLAATWFAGFSTLAFALGLILWIEKQRDLAVGVLTMAGIVAGCLLSLLT